MIYSGETALTNIKNKLQLDMHIKLKASQLTLFNFKINNSWRSL